MNNQDKNVGIIVGKLKTNFPVNSAIAVRNTETGQSYSIVSETTTDVPDKDHYMNLFYCVQLPAGTYMIDSVDTENANYKGSPIDVNVRFKVRAGVVQYFSTLIIEKQLMTSLGNTFTARLKMRWEDEYNTAEKELKTQCPWLTDAQLMKH